MILRPEEKSAAVDRGAQADRRAGHTVEKIGGTSMSRARELVETILIGKRSAAALGFGLALP